MVDTSDQHRPKATPVSPSGPLDHDEYNVDEFYRRLQEEQNLPLGIIAGLVAAMIGAMLWGLIALGLRIESAAIALLIGFLVGQALRVFGKGVTFPFPVAGAVLAAFGCVLGKLLGATALYAMKHDLEVTKVFMDVLSRPHAVMRLLTATMGPLDALFYILAICEASKLSLRPVVFNKD